MCRATSSRHTLLCCFGLSYMLRTELSSSDCCSVETVCNCLRRLAYMSESDFMFVLSLRTIPHRVGVLVTD